MTIVNIITNDFGTTFQLFSDASADCSFTMLKERHILYLCSRDP